MESFEPKKFLILVVDDVGKNLQLALSVLDQAGYDTTFATSGYQALERIRRVKPDLLLLDLMMPGMNGFEVCQHLQANPAYRDLPVIFLSASSEKSNLLQAFEQGAVDYVTKPFHAAELLARVRLHLELKHTQKQLKTALDDLSTAYRELKKTATTDSLTGIYNRRYLFQFAQAELERARRYQRPLSVLLLDIDRFKDINDTYGHGVGDRALQVLANTISRLLRHEACFGRYGGEEFIVILPESDVQAAVAIAERFRKAVAQVSIPSDEQSVKDSSDFVKMTVSIGVATYQEEETLDHLFKRADRALYRAKNQGRDRVVASYAD